MASENKKLLVRELTDNLQKYPVIGLVDIKNLPARQLQKIRSLLKSKNIRITMTRKKLLKLALAGSKKENIEVLAEKIKGLPALILCQENPFVLYSILQKNKSEASAKAGQTAPKDIIIKAGPTNFAPGPIISELAAVGIKTKVDGGKLTILADTTIAKEGVVITPKLAETLKRLDVRPMEIGLNLVAVWEKGFIFDAKELHLDEAEYFQNITLAAQWALNLALESAYPHPETIVLLLQKSFREAKAIGLEQNILTPETREEILAKVEREALALKSETSL